MDYIKTKLKKDSTKNNAKKKPNYTETAVIPRINEVNFKQTGADVIEAVSDVEAL